MKFKMLVSTCLILGWIESYAQTKSKVCYNDHCPTGQPQSNILVDHGIFVLSSNINTKFADWVAYKVIAKNLDGPNRKRNWKSDPNIPVGYTMTPSDYKDAHAIIGTDRGHQAPLGVFSNTDKWQLSNYLSNITPQKSELNQGAWNLLENAVRDLARSGEEVYVVTGPLYESFFPNLPNAQITHTTPSGYWKSIIVQNSNGISLSSFIMPQNAERYDSHCNYVSTLSEVQYRAKLDIFPERYLMLQQDSLLEKLGCMLKAS
ncbi:MULTISPECIES: DNA/RNA non-specific endonuclease [Cysteiniphilum]|uniref:DNA/RNA non-specific endonuclease n=1 Tax=Cysteiniphilum TaxID=2056696 RepID=UPI00177E84C4|nr:MULTISPECIES: DNA/RNA non-specific endonuclease [Cysteiniphilum]